VTPDEYPEGGFTVTVKGSTLLLTLAAGAVAVGYVVQDHIRSPYDQLFREIGGRFKVDPNLLRAIARKESNMQAGAISPPNRDGKRDYGLMQINANMFASLGITEAEAMIPKRSIEAACKLIVSLRRELGEKLSIHTLIAAYNAGSPAIKSRGIFNAVYVADVMSHYQLYTWGSTFA
jgi:soluble lytic murein transglycosylase-like protein